MNPLSYLEKCKANYTKILLICVRPQHIDTLNSYWAEKTMTYWFKIENNEPIEYIDIPRRMNGFELMVYISELILVQKTHAKSHTLMPHKIFLNFSWNTYTIFRSMALDNQNLKSEKIQRANRKSLKNSSLQAVFCDTTQYLFKLSL